MTNRELRERWEMLHRDGAFREVLPPDIRDSWERSYHYRIDPYLRQNIYICTEQELREAQERASYLLKPSESVMHGLYDFVAGTGFVIAMMDTNHCVLKVVGDEESLAWAKVARLVEGSMWAEDLVGTNAGALALCLAKPVSVFGYEHFCLFSHVAACSVAPIMDQGKIIGALGMVAPYSRVSHHTLGMTVAAAKHIKSKLLWERARTYHELVMNTMSEGVLTVDLEGNVAYMNSKCGRILKEDEKKAVGRKLYEIIANHPENQYFLNLMLQGRVINDESVVLVVRGEKVRLNVTVSPLNNPDPLYGGTLAIIREGRKVDRMVRNWIGGGAKKTFDDIIGQDPRFCQVLKTAKAAAASSSNVLLLGESGTGKDIIAQAMHNASARRNNPFVAINCAAFPRDLIASELFGYEDGAFTGAKKGGNMGKFELADQGTIFLDEIGDMPLDLQASLLRVLEEKSVMRLGGTKMIPVNVRIIAATNKDLEAEVERGRFRRDLYYRLGVIRITIPPLRERKADIPLLANYLVENICRRFGKKVQKLSPEVIEVFCEYDWPGNVREMQNVLEGAVQMTEGDEISLDVIKEYVQGYQFGSIKEEKGEEAAIRNDEDLSSVEKRMIIEYLEKNRFNKTLTAKALGMSRRTLYRRLKEYNLL